MIIIVVDYSACLDRLKGFVMWCTEILILTNVKVYDFSNQNILIEIVNLLPLVKVNENLNPHLWWKKSCDSNGIWDKPARQCDTAASAA